MSNYFALGKPGNFLNFFKGNAVSPRSPYNPVGTILGRFRFFDPSNWVAGLFGFHDLKKKISLLQFSLLDKWIGTNQYFFYDTYDITWVGHLLKVEACFRFIELKTNQKRRTKI